jgi:hypothetical protein
MAKATNMRDFARCFLPQVSVAGERKRLLSLSEAGIASFFRYLLLVFLKYSFIGSK